MTRVSTEVLDAGELGAVRAFAFACPFPTGVETPHELVAPHETALYRFYDRDGDLLYVGISWNPFKRWSTHAARAPWHGQAARVLVDVYRSEREALRIEREWIRNAWPTWNVRSAVT